MIPGIWTMLGFNMVVYLAGLQTISPEYYEVARIEGASVLQQFRLITLPLLKPITFFIFVMASIRSFQVFDQVWIMTGGGPAGATSVLVEQIVKNAFSYSRMGYAATLSWVLFLLVFIATAFQMRLQKQWVTYD